MFPVEHFEGVLYLKKIKITFKLLVLFIVIAFSIYRAAVASKVAGIDEVSNLVFNEGYSAPDVFEMVNGVYYENLAEKWGEPDGKLSDIRGDFWIIGNNKQIIVYYDSEGCVRNVRIDNIKTDTDGNV